MSTETLQISAEQAEIYEARFVPATFAQWAGLVLDLAGGSKISARPRPESRPP